MIRADIVDRLESPQQVARLGKVRGGRRVQPAQAGGVAGAPAAKFECEGSEIGVQNLGRRLRREGGVRTFGPEPVAMARAQSAGAAAALIRRRLRDFPRHQPAHAGRRVELSIAAQPRVDHDSNALDGQAGFGDGGREDDFSLSGGRRLERRVLRGGRQLAVQRQHADAIEIRFLQRALHAADLGGARQEAQDVAVVTLERHPKRLCGLRLDRDLGAARDMVSLDLEAACLGGDDGRLIEQARERLQVEGGRHHQQPQILAQRFLALDAQRETEIGIEAALVKFVEDRRSRCRTAPNRPAACG